MPSQNKSPLQWHVINDFKPGIHEVISPNHPDGAADPDGTWGCHADASGALCPLPGATEHDVPNVSLAADNADTFISINGLFCHGPVFSLDAANPTTPDSDGTVNNNELYFCLEHWETDERTQIDTLTFYNCSTSSGVFALQAAVVDSNGDVGTAQTTATITYSADVSTEINDELEALSNITGVTVGGPTVSGDSTTYTIQWDNPTKVQFGPIWYQAPPSGVGSFAAANTALPFSVYSSITTPRDSIFDDVFRIPVNRDEDTVEQVMTESDEQQWYSTNRPNHCTFGATRSNSGGTSGGGSSIEDVGPSVVAFVVNGRAQFFPDDTLPQAQSTGKMPGDPDHSAYPAPPLDVIWPADLVLHQGRAVIFPLTLSAMGILQTMVSNEAIYWTGVNNLPELDTELNGYFNVVAVPEHPTGYAVMASLTANELFLVKGQGGAVFLQGDLNNHTSRNLPNVKSAGQALCNGSHSPLGYMYGVDFGGVWLWQGGDVSQNISKQMKDEFWRPDYSSSDWGKEHTQCDEWQQLVMFPNNYLFDTDFGGWWRIDDPSDHVIYRWSRDFMDRRLYGTPQGLDHNTSLQTQPLYYEYDWQSKRDTYQWQSHPLQFTAERIVNVEEIVVVCSNSVSGAEVTVTANSAFSEHDDAPAKNVATFDISPETGMDPDIPVVVRKRIKCQGAHVSLKIEVDSGDPNTEAPTFDEVRIGYQEVKRIQR